MVALAALTRVVLLVTGGYKVQSLVQVSSC